jgi:hypothetical protein
MAKSQYNADSAPLPLPHLRSGMPASIMDIPVKSTGFAALPVNNDPTAAETCALAGDANVYVGEGAHYGRLLSGRSASDVSSPLSGLSPTSID